MNITLNVEPGISEESKRIETLYKYDILDTPPDGIFDRIAKLASKLLDVPIAIVSLVDTDRIWFKSAFGLDVRQIPRERGLCASAILSSEFYMVKDAIRDPRTIENSLVKGEFGLRFYAAAPLTTKDGYNLGNLCVVDKRSRELTDDQKEILEDLAAVVMEQMELRLATRIAINSQNKMAYLITHDIKGAMINIPSLVELVQKNKDKVEEVEEVCSLIAYSSEKSLKAIDTFLRYATSTAQDIIYQFREVDFSALVSKVISTNQVIAQKKKQVLEATIEPRITVCGDNSRLIEIVDNLINNAIKYSPHDKKIRIVLKRTGNSLLFKVIDEGQGLSDNDKKLAFKRFAKLSAQPTGDEISTGLGLWIVKEITEKHNGKAWVESEGIGKGATFCVELPLLDRTRES